jgi:hypothetical protein
VSRFFQFRVLSGCVSSVWLTLIPLSPFASLCAQSIPYERSYSNPKAEVEQTLRNLDAYSGGRLPVLDGFVRQGDQPLDRYQRAYYRYSIQVLTSLSAKTLVRVTAKITAWYVDPAPPRSRYEELPSNGRLESDLLDRVDEALGGKSSVPAAGSVSNSGTPRIDLSLGISSPVLRRPLSVPAPAAALVAEASSYLRTPASAAPTEADVDALRKEREAAEKRLQELNSTAQGLQEILRNQAHPKNLAVVRKSGTLVLARPADNARVLFRAEAEDEFEILDLEREWVHVGISGPSRGWIRRSQLDLAEAVVGSPAATGTAAVQSSAELFRIIREETSPFAGAWEPLKGKTVKVIWVQSTTQDGEQNGPGAKLSLAKSVFLKTASELARSPAEIAGVVVVFDSVDGGQAAATLPVLEQWKAGTLSDAAFWEQSSLDPFEAFQIPAKH